jgi:SAM-dependent methyltransferase
LRFFGGLFEGRKPVTQPKRVPSTDKILQGRRRISERYGPWTTDINLGHGVRTLDGEAKSRGRRLGRIVRIVSDVAGKPLGELRILDLACLEGMFAVEFARLGANVVGIEGREANVARARFAKEALSLENLEFCQDDVRNLSKEKYGTFDVVLCLGILYHLNPPDVFRFVERIAEVCERFAVIDTHVSFAAEESHVYKGKEFLGSSYDEHNPNATQDERSKLTWASLDNPTSLWLTRPSLYNLLSFAGFTSVWECHNPRQTGTAEDRLTLLAINGERISSLPSAPEDPMPEEVPWPETREAQKPRIEELESGLANERQRNRMLSARIRVLEREIQSKGSSKTWKALTRLNRIKARLGGR